MKNSDAQISGPAIIHFLQMPDGWDALIVTFIGAAEAQRAQIGWVDPVDASYDQPWLYLEPGVRLPTAAPETLRVENFQNSKLRSD